MTLPTTTATAAEPRPSPAEAIHRRPHTVSAQVMPLPSASRLPRSGSGAVSTGWSTPTKNSASPTPTAAMNARSCRRVGSRRSQGARIAR